MQKIYSLLRNNKQSGPYTLDEIIQQALKPFDLIWVDGSSAGWAYPTEIESLKPFVASQSKIEAVKNESLTAVPISSPEASVQNQSVSTSNTISSVHTQAHSKHIFVSLPSKGNVTAAISPPIISSTNADEESPEEKLEKKATALRNKIQAFEQTKQHPKPTDELDTKYTRSLDDIKDEYAHWLHHQKSKRNFQYKNQLLIAASVMALLLTSYFAGNYFFTSDAAMIKPFAVQKQESLPAEFAVVPSEDQQPKQLVKKAKKIAPANVKKNISSTKKVIAEDNIAAFIDSLKSVHAHAASIQIKPDNKEEISPAAEVDKGQRTATRRDQTHPTNASVAKQEPINIAQQIKMSESKNEEGEFLTIYNNSNQFINFVAVDVLYYKSNLKLIRKKTLYFNNIRPGSFVKKAVPDLSRAESNSYTLGLISTDGGLYYAKQ